jgi:putative metallohydrolase (TIGR04338 family)
MQQLQTALQQYFGPALSRRARRRDSQRSRVYAWERAIRNRDERGFNSIDEVEAFALPIWRKERGRYGLAKAAPPRFKAARWGQRRAIAYDSHEISLPRGWGRQPSVVLHELAHRLTPSDAQAHGPRFVAVLIGLLARHAGYDAQRLVEVAEAMGVRYHARSIGAVPATALSSKVEQLIRRDGPMGDVDIAIALDVHWRQVRGAVLVLAKAGRARWFRKRLILLS